MHKSEAIQLLGGTNVAAAKAIGISPAAVSQWTDPLTAPVTDRVVAAIARKHLSAALIGSESELLPSPAGSPAAPVAEKAQA